MLDVIRRIADRGLKHSQRELNSQIDIWQHLIDHLERVEPIEINQEWLSLCGKDVITVCAELNTGGWKAGTIYSDHIASHIWYTQNTSRHRKPKLFNTSDYKRILYLGEGDVNEL